MSSLIEFLEARLAEDEGTALAAFQARSTYGDYADGEVYREDTASEDAREASIAHWRAFDPARVLAECAAKRQIIALHGAVEVLWPSRFTAAYCCTGCFGAVQMDTQPDGTPLTPDGNETATPEPCGTLLALAAPYASHPDFDPSWAGGTQP